MIRTHRLLPILLGVLTLFSCSSDFLDRSVGSQQESSYQDVDKALWSYFTLFENEALSRGIDIDLNGLGISGEITTISQEDVAGICHSGQHNAHITIDQNFWNSAGDLYREYVVFHELGHCVLGRGHREAIHPSGHCKSIMASGVGRCIPNYRDSTRDEYVDELFFYVD